MNAGEVIRFIMKNDKVASDALRTALKNNDIRKFIDTIFREIKNYPLLVKRPLKCMSEIIEIIINIVVKNPTEIQEITEDINSKLRYNDNITLDEFLEFTEEIRENHAINKDAIIIPEVPGIHFFVSGKDVVFSTNGRSIRFIKNALMNLKNLAEKYDAKIVMTSSIEHKSFEEKLMKELSKHELYERYVRILPSEIDVNKTDKISQAVSKKGLELNSVVIFDRRNHLGKNLKDRLVTCKNGIDDANVRQVAKLIAEYY